MDEKLRAALRRAGGDSVVIPRQLCLVGAIVAEACQVALKRMLAGHEMIVGSVSVRQQRELDDLLFQLKGIEAQFKAALEDE